MYLKSQSKIQKIVALYNRAENLVKTFCYQTNKSDENELERLFGCKIEFVCIHKMKKTNALKCRSM